MANPEHLDITPATPPRGAGLVVVVLAVIGILVAALVLGPGRLWSSPEPSRSVSEPKPVPRSSSVPTEESTRTVPPLPPPPAKNGWRWTAMHPYDAPASLQLLLASRQGLVRVDLDHGWLAVYAATNQGEPPGGTGSIVALPDGVVFQRYDPAAYLLANASTLTSVAAPQPDTPSTLVRWFPGPSQQWPVLRDVDVMGHHTVQALDLRGHVRTIAVPAGVDGPSLGSDGHGGLLVQRADGVTFAVSVDGVRRVADNPVVAVGPTRLLTVHCDGDGPCSYEVVDPTGQMAPLRLPGAVLGSATGAVSPDGATAILQSQGANGHAQLTLLDLATGARRPAGQLDTYATGLVWSPDSRLVMSSLWLGTPADDGPGLLLVVDARTATATQLTLPGVSDIGALAIDPYSRPGWGS